MSHRNRRHRRPQGFSSAPIKSSLQPTAEREGLDDCRVLALRIIHAILTRDHPEDCAQLMSATSAVLDQPPATVSGVLGYLAHVSAEHFQFAGGGKAAAISQIERLSELSAAEPAGADSTEPT